MVVRRNDEAEEIASDGGQATAVSSATEATVAVSNQQQATDATGCVGKTWWLWKLEQKKAEGEDEQRP
ncbi:S9 family peptidase [Sesbania bispinosa]|nr:S9 family peptidase [Sesbania bispinosa]